MDYKKIVIIVIVLFVAGFAILFSRGDNKNASCIADAKICSDGSYVSRVLPECNFTACPKQDLIRVENIEANDIITSPFTIKGEARGYWFFEANFPIKLFNENGEVLDIAVAQAQSDWMTEDFVPFVAELEFEPSKTEKGTIVLEKDNPSGLPENADELRIPVLFAQEIQKINLYYYNPEMDTDDLGNIQCSRDGVVAVEREIVLTKTPIQDSINLLLLGELTEEERLQGISTEYPLEGFSLKGASLDEETLTLEFNDLSNETIGGSCRVGILWFQVEATAKQFSEVNEVKFLPEDIFQP